MCETESQLVRLVGGGSFNITLQYSPSVTTGIIREMLQYCVVQTIIYELFLFTNITNT